MLLKNKGEKYISDEIKRLRHEKKMIQQELKSDTSNRPELISKARDLSLFQRLGR